MVVVSCLKWKNLTGVLLENEVLQVVVLPELGGKTASIYHKSNSFELVSQNKKDSYNIPPPNAEFTNYDASGFDDAFPTIEAAMLEWNGLNLKYPDHGEIWREKFIYRIQDDVLHLNFTSDNFPYHYHKRIMLDGESVIYKYKITNTEEEAFPCLWAFHGLVRYEEDMQLYYPNGVKEFINVLESPELGRIGKIYDNLNDEYDFNNVPNINSNTMIKYYVNGKVEHGCCGYIYPSQGMHCNILYDSTKLPYLGMWITAGGFRGDYNCAFEPTNGYYDNILIAKENYSLFMLRKNEPLEFSLKIRLIQMN